MQAPRTHMWCNWSSKRLLRTNLLMLLATKVSKVRSSSTSILPDAHWMHFDFLVMWVWNQFSYSCSVVVLELPTYSAMVGDLADSWCAALHSKDGKSGTSSRAGWLFNSPIQLQPPQSHLMPRGLQSPTLSFFFFPVSHFEVRVFFFLIAVIRIFSMLQLCHCPWCIEDHHSATDVVYSGECYIKLTCWFFRHTGRIFATL